ncbi:MAG: hypothetical protein ACPIOQ_04335 [Promethearchaeia archaeon]
MTTQGQGAVPTTGATRPVCTSKRAGGHNNHRRLQASNGKSGYRRFHRETATPSASSAP